MKKKNEEELWRNLKILSDKWKSNGETLLKTFFNDGESSRNEESRRKKWRFSALGDGNGRIYKRKFDYFHL